MNQRVITIKRLTKAKPPWWSQKEQAEYIQALKDGPNYEALKEWVLQMHAMYLVAEGPEKQALETVMHACDENGVAMSQRMFTRGMQMFEAAI